MQSESPAPFDRQDPQEQPSTNSLPIFEGRLHPLTLLFGVIKGLRGIIALIPLLLFGNRWLGGISLVMILMGTVLTSIVRYFSFSYRIEGNELITQQGLIERKQRNIPLERVQEIRVEQGVMHRIFGVVDARIETGGGEGAEASLSVLSRDEVERLRRAVFERAAAIRASAASAPAEGASEPAPQSEVIRKLSVKDLVFAGLTSNHLLSALVLAGAIWNFADDILPESIYRRAADFAFRHSRELLSQGVAKTIILTIAGLAALFLIGVIFSIAGTIVLFYGFTFSRRGEDLHRNYGLLTRRSSSLPRRRIQVLEIEEKLLRRLFKLATVRADTSGSHKENEDDNSGRDVLLPIIPRGEVDHLLPLFFRDFDSDRPEWRRVSKLAIRRGTIRGSIVCLIAATALSAYYQDPTGLWLLAFAPLAYWISLIRYRTLGYAYGDLYFSTRRGWLGRSTHIVPINKIQAVEIQQSPFDRRLGLATLYLDTAGQAYTGGGPQISNLPIAEARSIAETLTRRAAITQYRW